MGSMPGGPTAKDFKDRFPQESIEVRRAQRVIDPPGWLVGKRTTIGLVLMAAGMVGHLFHFEVPKDEINTLLDTVLANWDGIMEVVAAVGVLITWIGSKLKQRRLKEAVAVVTDNTNKLTDTRAELIKIKASVEAAPLAESTKDKILE